MGVKYMGATEKLKPVEAAERFINKLFPYC